jgi:predicted dehydrogenase
LTAFDEDTTLKIISCERKGIRKMLDFAIIGVGANVFHRHRPALHLPDVKVIAVSDVHASVGQQRAAELGCAFYADYQQLLDQARPEVVVIMTPHTLHARIAIDCLQAGCHVLVEKPMAVQVVEADAMIEAANRSQRLLGVILQHRFRPEVRAAHKLIREGLLGDIQHVELSAAWPRPARYYQSASWRGTWTGEGGGVVMNQAPHHLDLLCHLVGMPDRVFSWTRNLLHQIETEDTVQAMLEWPNGALGSLCISTAFADQSESIKIVGSAGFLAIHNGELSYFRFDPDMHDFALSYVEQPLPLAQHIPLALPSGAGNHAAVYRNFCDAIEHKDDFISTGEEARMSLEVANSLIYSGYTGTMAELPLDRQRYAALLATLQRHETHRKVVAL